MYKMHSFVRLSYTSYPPVFVSMSCCFHSFNLIFSHGGLRVAPPTAISLWAETGYTFLQCIVVWKIKYIKKCIRVNLPSRAFSVRMYSAKRTTGSSSLKLDSYDRWTTTRWRCFRKLSCHMLFVHTFVRSKVCLFLKSLHGQRDSPAALVA